jgi:hypothetical protein
MRVVIDAPELNYSDPFGLWPGLSSIRFWLNNTTSGQIATAVACFQGCRAMTPEAQRGLDAANDRFGALLLVASVAAPSHHLATNKNSVSAVRGGPWTPRFARIFERAGMSLDDASNRIEVLGHRGPHPREYHQTVFDRLTQATEGLVGAEYRAALVNELRAIAADVTTPGSPLNKLVTKTP